MRLRVDQEVAVEHHLVASARPLETGNRSSEGAPTCDLARFKDAIGPGKIHDLPRARIEHRRARNHDRWLRRAAHKRRVDKHARQQPHARIGHMHMHRNRARLRVGRTAR